MTKYVNLVFVTHMMNSEVVTTKAYDYFVASSGEAE